MRVIVTIKNNKGTCYDLEAPNTIDGGLFVEKIIEVIGVFDEDFVNSVRLKKIIVEGSNIEIDRNEKLENYGVVDGSTLIIS